MQYQVDKQDIAYARQYDKLRECMYSPMNKLSQVVNLFEDYDVNYQLRPK